MMELRCHFLDVATDFEQEPEWAGFIKRWPQLDGASKALAEATWQLKDRLTLPEELVLTSAQGSIETDLNFVRSGKVSPSLFVHTLPNVRTLAYSSLTAFEGPVFCFSQGKSSLVKFLYEMILTSSAKRTLVINLNRKGKGYQCEFFELNSPLGTHQLEGEATGRLLLDDRMMREQMLTTGSATLTDSLTLRKK